MFHVEQSLNAVLNMRIVPRGTMVKFGVDNCGGICYNIRMKKKNTIVGVRLDERTAERLDSIAAEFDVNRSTVIRWMIGYLDDRACPCGRFRGFREWRKRMETLSERNCL